MRPQHRSCVSPPDSTLEVLVQPKNGVARELIEAWLNEARWSFDSDTGPVYGDYAACTCEHGTPATGPECNGQEKCASCYNPCSPDRSNLWCCQLTLDHTPASRWATSSRACPTAAERARRRRHQATPRRHVDLFQTSSLPA